MILRRLPQIVMLSLPLALVATTAMQRGGESSGIAGGREVYIAEGCIHCHSQYVRPGSVDVELWGEPHDPEFSRQQSPALIGNRRQGPDLMNVGLRRTREWQKLHLIQPRLVSPQSRMPSYAHLFAAGDRRGEALLDYLDSLGREGEAAGSARADSAFAPGLTASKSAPARTP